MLFRGASILFAVFSVYYWFRASTVTVTDADKRYDPKFDFVVNGGEIGRCAVIAVPHVVDRNLVAFDFCPGGLSNIRLPGTIVAGL